MQPSSPYLPCRALNTTSGPPPPAGRRKSTSARRSRLTSYSTTSCPPSRSPAAHLLAQRLDVGRSGGAAIDQEVAMLLGDLRLADAQAAAAGLVDQFPRLVTGRVDEGRAAGAAARLRFGAGSVDLGDAAGDLGGIARLGFEPDRGEDPVGRRTDMTV